MVEYCDPMGSISEWRERDSWFDAQSEQYLKDLRAQRALEDAIRIVRAEGESPKVFEAPSIESLPERFAKLAEEWENSTRHLSSPAQIMMHPNYQAVLGMAQENRDELVRLMLTDLRDHNRAWFWALSYLTGDNPIKTSEAGKFDKMIKAWIKWGKERGIL